MSDLKKEQPSVIAFPSLAAHGLDLRLSVDPARQRLCAVAMPLEDQSLSEQTLLALDMAGFERIPDATDNRVWVRSADGLTPRMLRTAGFAEITPARVPRSDVFRPWPGRRPGDIEKLDATETPTIVSEPALEQPIVEAFADIEDALPKSRKPRERISDFGAKIGGARKDLAATDRITGEMITGWSAEERSKLLTKSRLWPAPDYRELVAGGADPEAIYAIKRIRDSLPASPRREGYSNRRRSTLPATLADEVLYTDVLRTLSERFSGVRTWDVFCEIAKSAVISRETEDFTGRKIDSWSLSEFGKQWFRVLTTTRLRKFAWDPFNDGYQLHRNLGNRSYLQTLMSRDEGWMGVEKSGGAPKRTARVGAAVTPQQRQGPDRRNGRDVTTEEFMATFGFRGGEFGNWEQQSRRQEIINAAYDAFMDLAEVLVIPPGALSLDGKLAIAFGARGQGNARAHYEPGRAVINLTKTSGAGALAHEWFHAFDNYCFGQMGSLSGPLHPYRSRAIENGYGQLREANKELRPELVVAWRGIMEAIKLRPLDPEKTAQILEVEAERSTDCAKSWFESVANRISYTVRESISARETAQIQRVIEVLTASRDTSRPVDAGALFDAYGESLKALRAPLRAMIEQATAADPKCDLAKLQHEVVTRAWESRRVESPESDNPSVARAKALVAEIISFKPYLDSAARRNLRHEDIKGLLQEYKKVCSAPLDKQVRKFTSIDGEAESYLERADDKRVMAQRIRSEGPDGSQLRELQNHTRVDGERLAAEIAAQRKNPEHAKHTLESLRATGFYGNAVVLDASRAKTNKYWSTPWELGARAFEAYVYDRLAATSWSSPYLVDTNRAEMTRAEDKADEAAVSAGNPRYPHGTERRAIGKAFDHLVGVLETKHTESGIALYSRAPQNAVGAAGMSLPQTCRAAAMIADRWQVQFRVGVVDAVEELPYRAPRNARAQLDPIARAIWLVRENLRNVEDAEFAIAHEYFGHVGLRGVLGSQHERTLTDIWADNLAVRQRVDEIVGEADRNGEHITRLLATEEALCDMAAEGRADEITGWSKIVGAFKSWLRDVGLESLAGRWTDNDVAYLLAQAREAAPELDMAVENKASSEAAAYEEETRVAIKPAMAMGM